MRTVQRMLILLVLVGATNALAQKGFACVADMEVPQMRGTVVGLAPAEVEATVSVGEHGRAKSIAVKTSIERLRLEITYYLREATTYTPECAGKSLKFVFKYAVQGQETDEITSEVHLQPPNTFLIITHPVKAIIDRRK